MTTRPTYRIGTLLLLVVLVLTQAACAPPACDPNSSAYAPDACETVIGRLVEYLTQLAYGHTPPPPSGSGPTCPPPLVCFPPQCLFMQENGSFEEDDAMGYPAFWYGDEAATTITASCHQDQGLDFIATTPDGAGPSTSAQVYQVIDLAGRIPSSQRAAFQRLRAQAAFNIATVEAEDDLQFGLRLDAYAGDPTTFPRTGDPADIPAGTDTYVRLASTADTLLYDGEVGEADAAWQAATAELTLPPAADFVVVLVEHEENVQNDTDRREFLDHAVDFVQVVIDGGNLPPLARPDYRRVPENQTQWVSVTANDFDATSRIDRSSVVITVPPDSGQATVDAVGGVRYTPHPGFVGADTLLYTVADEEGLVSAPAVVAFAVFDINDVPVARDDTYELPEGDLLLVPAGVGVLANDTDADGDTLTAVLVQDVEAGALTLDSTGAFTYAAPEGLVGTTTFTYRAQDGEAASAPATVTLVGNTPPVAVNDTYDFPDGGGLDVPADGGVLENDTDVDSDSLTAELVRDVGVGALQLAASGAFTYAAPSAFTGTTTFTYRARDGGAASDTATVTLAGSGNQPPIVVAPIADQDIGASDAPRTIDLTAVFDDPEGDALTYDRIVEAGSVGVFDATISEGVLTLTPLAPGGPFQVEVIARDSLLRRARVNFSVTVTPPTTYDLALTKTAMPTTVGPSGEATFTVTLTNSGPAAATGIEVVDQLPGIELTVQSVTASQGAFDASTGVWAVGSLAAGAQATLAITALVHLDATNTAAITAGLGADTDASNNSASATVQVVDNTPNAPPVVSDPLPDVAVTADPPSSCSFDLNSHFSDPDGEALTFSYTLSNGNVNAELSGSTLVVSGWSFGQTTVTVTAQDPRGASVSDALTATSGTVADCSGNSSAP